MSKSDKCNPHGIYPYIYLMKNRITIEDDLPELKKEDLKAAAQRRENYAVARDLQAAEFNVAIERRLEKDKQDRKA